MARRSRVRLSLAKRLVFAALCLSVLLTAAELMCLGRERLGAGRVEYYPAEPDAYRTIVLSPGAVHAFEGRRATINAFGMRGPEVQIERPRVRRILCVGASSTYGLVVTANEHTWPARLERLLRAAGQEVEVLNAGVPSWTVRESQTNLELRLEVLRPDLIVVCHMFNDIMANPEPGYEKDSCAEDAHALWRPWRESALLRAVAHRLDGRKHRLSNKTTRWRPEGVAAFERNLRRLVRRGQALGSRVVLTTEPTCLRPTLDLSRRDDVPAFDAWYDHYCTLDYPTLMSAIEEYRHSTRVVAAETGATFLDLESVMPDDVKLWGTPIHRHDAGEEVFASLVRATVERELMSSLAAARD